MSFSSSELTFMRTAQEAAMQDTCVILRPDTSTDDWNNPSDETYFAQDAISCGLQHLSPKEVQGQQLVPEITARIRFPIDTDVRSDDRIAVTHRFGEELTDAQDDSDPQVFEIVGPVRRGPSGLVVDVKMATDGKGYVP